MYMREGWTDGRLDDFAKHVDQRFDAVDQRFKAVDQRFDTVDQRFDAVDKRFDRVEDELHLLKDHLGRLDGRIDDLHHAVIQLGAGAIATIVVGFLGMIIALSVGA